MTRPLVGSAGSSSPSPSPASSIEKPSVTGLAVEIDSIDVWAEGRYDEPMVGLTGPLLKLSVTGLSETGRADGAAGACDAASASTTSYCVRNYTLRSGDTPTFPFLFFSFLGRL